MLNQEVYDGISALYKSKSYNDLKNDDSKVFFSDNQCYLSRFYILPEYRKKGLGHYLLNNLDNILNEAFNINIGFIVAYIKPLILENIYWVECDDRENKMRKYMEKFFKKNGFLKVKTSKYYLKKCTYI